MKAKKKHPKSVRSNSGVLEQLEARILFSADLFSTLLDSDDKSESAASDTEGLDSLLENPTAITSALDKIKLDEQNEKNHSSNSTRAPSVPTSVAESISEEQFESTHNTEQQHTVTALKSDKLSKNADSTIGLSDATHTESPGLYIFDSNEEGAVDDALETTLDKPERTELIFIDGSVEDSDQLLGELRDGDSSNTEWIVIELDSSRNGIEEITETLEGVVDIDAIHIISHGDGQGIQLGTEKLTTENFNQYREAIDSWSSTFTEDVDLLIYGCNLASTDVGKTLLEDLSASCDCDVAASDDTTGHESLQSNWDLEYELGEVTTDVALPVSVQSAWHGTLLLDNLGDAWRCFVCECYGLYTSMEQC